MAPCFQSVNEVCSSYSINRQKRMTTITTLVHVYQGFNNCGTCESTLKLYFQAHYSFTFTIGWLITRSTTLNTLGKLP